MSTRMPAIFFGHGNPMNAIQQNHYTERWNAIGAELPKPKAVVMVSAHWYIRGTKITAMPTPATIHDFGGFPRELSEFQYPAPGDPALAERLAALLHATPDTEWGLDHGAWSVLCHVFPNADVPIVQLSLDRTLRPAEHYAIGRRLAALRDQGILIAASGNIIHNLRYYNWGQADAPAYEWALRFETAIRNAVAAGDHDTAIGYEALGEDAHLACPTPEHFLPLLYILGAQQPGDAVDFPIEGIEGGSISMLSVQLSGMTGA